MPLYYGQVLLRTRGELPMRLSEGESPRDSDEWVSHSTYTTIEEQRLMGWRSAVLAAVFASCLAIIPSSNLCAQSITATLTGVVSDPAQAVVPNATVKLNNEESGSLRETTTNNEGYFTFASVVAGN